MADEMKEQNATVDEVDYVKELEEAKQRAEANRIGYAVRHAAKETQKDDEELPDTDKIAARVIERLTPVINSATQSNLVETRLNELSKGNDALKSLIRFHMDNTVNQTLPLADRVEAAYAIANKKVIAKTVQELNVAHQNRAQMITTGVGANQDQIKPGTNLVSDEQRKQLEAKAEQFAQAANWPTSIREAKKKEFVENAIKSLAQAR